MNFFKKLFSTKKQKNKRESIMKAQIFPDCIRPIILTKDISKKKLKSECWMAV